MEFSIQPMVQQTYRDSTGDYSTRQIYKECYSGPKGDVTTYTGFPTGYERSFRSCGSYTVYLTTCIGLPIALLWRSLQFL